MTVSVKPDRIYSYSAQRPPPSGSTEAQRCCTTLHAKVSHIGDGARAFRGLEGAIENGEMLVLDVRRAFDGAGGVDVADDGIGLLMAR